MGKKSLTLAVATCAVASVLAGCSSAGCIDGRSGVPQAEFRSSATGAVIRVDSLRISGVGAPGDSAVLSPPAFTSFVYLPLKADSHTTSWCIAYKQRALDHPELNDTLTFDYDSTPYFVSDDCGVGFRYHINNLSCTSHLIDSVEILDPLVTATDKAYVAIYFRTQE
ncbi:MAG: hypothetical protein K2G24_02470 [Muribaculaceae bacterium]|nr:hypothetical protein [Muribaculaceae bacterium]